MHSAVADAKPWPAWLCPSGHLASQLLPLDDVPEEKEPDDGQEEKEKHDDDDDETEKHEGDEEDEEQTHKKAAVAAKLAQDEEEARAQAAVAAKRKQAATLVGSRRCGVGSKSARWRWERLFACCSRGDASLFPRCRCAAGAVVPSTYHCSRSCGVVLAAAGCSREGRPCHGSREQCCDAVLMLCAIG